MCGTLEAFSQFMKRVVDGSASMRVVTPAPTEVRCDAAVGIDRSRECWHLSLNGLGTLQKALSLGNLPGPLAPDAPACLRGDVPPD